MHAFLDLAGFQLAASVRVVLSFEACDNSGRVQAAAAAIRGACGGVYLHFLRRAGTAQERGLGVAERRVGPSRGPARFLVDP